MEVLLYAIPLGFTLSLAAGPVFFVVVETSISKGKAAAFSLDMGAVVADLLFILIAFYGSQSFISHLKNNPVLNIISGLLVVLFGIYYFFKSRRSGQFQRKIEIKRKRFFFVKGFLLNFLNIGVLFFWLATTVAIGGMVNHEPRSMWVFYGACLGSYILLDLLKIFFANRFKERLRGRNLQVVERLIAFILMGFGVFIAVRNFF